MVWRARVDKKVDFEGNMKEAKRRSRTIAHADALARIEQGELVVPLSPNQTLASTLAPLVKRTLPVFAPAQMRRATKTRTMRITAPAVKMGRAPARREENGGEIRPAKLEVFAIRRIRAGRGEAKRRLRSAPHPRDKYAPWRAFIQRIRRLMHRSVRAIKGGK